ncbi:MAG: response regulator transcription factor [Phycisphaerae bacterium]|nr:response regulator transcription factor [Phycisphaerae bacterium]
MPVRQAARPLAARKASPPPSHATRTTIRVLSVGADSQSTAGLVLPAPHEEPILLVGTLESSNLVLTDIVRLRPDVVLLDAEAPGADSFSVAATIAERHLGTHVIMRTAHASEPLFEAAYRSGASGIFLRSEDPADLREGICTVANSHDGVFVVGPKFREGCVLCAHANGQKLASSRSAPGSAAEAPRELRPRADHQADSTLHVRLGLLSPRELEVLRHIGQGLSRTEIAETLCRSAKTIDGHQERILRKLGLSSRSDLIRFAIREKLVEA